MASVLTRNDLHIPLYFSFEEKFRRHDRGRGNPRLAAVYGRALFRAANIMPRPINRWNPPAGAVGFECYLRAERHIHNGILASAKHEPHTKDGDCTVSDETLCCVVCGVDHSEECVDCGGRGFHKVTCELLLSLEA